MKGFISYKHTGEDNDELKSILTPIIDKLNESSVDAYCNLFDQELIKKSTNYKPKDYVFDALDILKDKDLIFVLLKSEEKSEGMLMEIGYALAKGIPVVIAIRSDIKRTYLPSMANLVIEWNDLHDLLSKISNTDFKLLK